MNPFLVLFTCCFYWFLKGLNQFRVSYPDDTRIPAQLHSEGALLILFYVSVFRLCWVFISTWAFFWLQWLLLLLSTDSRAHSGTCGSRAQYLQLLGPSAQAQQLWHTGLGAPQCVGSRPGVEPASPILSGKFFTTEPPGKLFIL